MLRNYPTAPFEFPIVINVQSGGNLSKHILDFGDKAICVFCGKPFKLNDENVFRYVHPFDNGAKIICPNCRKVADAYYYANNSNMREVSDEWEFQS